MPQHRPLRTWPALVCALAVVGCATQQQIVANKEDNLAAAGFVQRPANTPKRQEMLNKLPPHQFVRRVHGDTVLYVYADPQVCDCLYVGTQQAYGKYRLHQQQQQIADEQQSAAELYSDPTWNWGAWGPWGAGYGPYFGTGYGYGW